MLQDHALLIQNATIQFRKLHEEHQEAYQTWDQESKERVNKIMNATFSKSEEYLKECLNSAIQQKEDIEIILIDNASSKNCSLVLQEYKNSNSKIKLIRFSKNKGYSGACNAGIEISQGEYLLFLDSDDILAPQICKTIIQHLNKHPSEICFFPFNIIDAQTKKILSTYTCLLYTSDAADE